MPGMDDARGGAPDEGTAGIAGTTGTTGATFDATGGTPGLGAGTGSDVTSHNGMNASARAMWRAFAYSDLAEVDDLPDGGRTPTAWAFGLGEAMENELAELVVAGIKRATATSRHAAEAAGDPLPRVGDYSVIYDGTRTARCIIRTTRVWTAPLSSVTDAFARREGEGDGSRRYWLDAHRRFFSQEHAELGLPFSDEVSVVFEEFQVVWPAEICDTTQT